MFIEDRKHSQEPNTLTYRVPLSTSFSLSSIEPLKVAVPVVSFDKSTNKDNVSLEKTPFVTTSFKNQDKKRQLELSTSENTSSYNFDHKRSRYTMKLQDQDEMAKYAKDDYPRPSVYHINVANIPGIKQDVDMKSAQEMVEFLYQLPITVPYNAKAFASAIQGLVNAGIDTITTLALAELQQWFPEGHDAVIISEAATKYMHSTRTNRPNSLRRTSMSIVEWLMACGIPQQQAMTYAGRLLGGGYQSLQDFEHFREEDQAFFRLGHGLLFRQCLKEAQIADAQEHLHPHHHDNNDNNDVLPTNLAYTTGGMHVPSSQHSNLPASTNFNDLTAEFVTNLQHPWESQNMMNTEILSGGHPRYHAYLNPENYASESNHMNVDIETNIEPIPLSSHSTIYNLPKGQDNYSSAPMSSMPNDSHDMHQGYNVPTGNQMPLYPYTTYGMDNRYGNIESATTTWPMSNNMASSQWSQSNSSAYNPHSNDINQQNLTTKVKTETSQVETTRPPRTRIPWTKEMEKLLEAASKDPRCKNGSKICWEFLHKGETGVEAYAPLTIYKPSELRSRYRSQFGDKKSIGNRRKGKEALAQAEAEAQALAQQNGASTNHNTSSHGKNSNGKKSTGDSVDQE